MIQVTENIQVNKAELNFHGVEETQVLVFVWDNTKYKNMRCNADKLGSWFDYDVQYDIVEDGVVGRAIYYITVHPFDRDEDPHKAYMTFYFFSDTNNFREDTRINITQTSTAREANFISLSQDAVVVPFTNAYNTVDVHGYNGATLGEVEFPNDKGVYGQVYGNEIQIYTLWDKIAFPGELISHQKITVNWTMPDASPRTNEIDVIFVMPHLCPVWQDVETSYITNDDVVDYSIYDMAVGDMNPQNAIYKGRIYKLPDEDRIHFNLNKIIENYLSQEIDLTNDAVIQHDDYGKDFRVKVNDKILGDYVFYNDWSYDPNKKRVWMVPQNVSDPITYDIVRGQTFADCIWIPSQTTNSDARYKVLQESPTNESGTFTPIPGYDDVYYSPYKYYTVVYNTKNLKPDSRYLLCNSKTYKVIDCPKVKWVVHYLDKRGGYSSYPVYGNVNVSSRSIPHSMNKTFSNTSSNFETKRYLFESEETYEATFPLLRKNEAIRIDEILQSTEIWLERLSDNRMIPVIADVTEFDYKNNRKVRTFTVPFITSQSRLRK